MGRQVYLTRLAFGRSAFEVPDVEEVPFLLVSQQPLTQVSSSLDNASGPYIQQFDSRGRPVNLQSQESGRRLREAQNDILAAIGAVERKRNANGAATATSNHSSCTEVEEKNASGTIWKIMRCVGVPVGLLFDIWKSQMALMSEQSLTEHAVEEFQNGFTPILRALPSYLFKTDIIALFVNLTPVRRVVDTALWLLRLQRHDLTLGYVLIALLCAPLQYHSSLVQLKLTSALFPSFDAWRVGSRASPYPSFKSLAGFFISPMIVSQIVTSLSYALLRHALEVPQTVISSNIIQPTNSATYQADLEERKQNSPDPSLPLRFPTLSRTLNFLGWSYSYTRRTILYTSNEQSAELMLIPRMNQFGTRPIPVSENVQAVEETPHESSHETTLRDHLDRTSNIDLESIYLPVPSARASIEHDVPAPVEPTVRITSRDGLHGNVEVEIQLPSEVVVTEEPSTLHREVLDRDASLSTQPHRVTALSRGPARLLSDFIRRFLVYEILHFPQRLICANFNMLYYVHTPPTDTTFGYTQSPLHTVGFWRQFFQDIKPSSLLNILSRVALSTAIEYMINAGLWGCHLALTVWKGKKYFKWGHL